jgi:drug/metabolite transporter (DMT)-like permease
MILSAAVLGRLLLHEAVNLRMALSILMLLTAIGVLTVGANDAFKSVVGAAAGESNYLRIAGGVAAALASGVAYTILGVAIRFAAGKGAAQATTLMTVATVGLISLGGISLLRIGAEGMLATPPADLTVMLAAGVFNAIAFVALTKALHVTTVVYVNALNATQATMAAVCGVWFFHEALSPALLAGVGLTIAGLVLMRGRRPRPAAGDSEDRQVVEECAIGCIAETAVASTPHGEGHRQD